MLGIGAAGIPVHPDERREGLNSDVDSRTGEGWICWGCILKVQKTGLRMKERGRPRIILQSIAGLAVSLT